MIDPILVDVDILTGPTASGKTALALEIAPRINAEIIAMDSMTLYRGMDVGTAKPNPTERRVVVHHLIDVLDPWESANVSWWLRRAADCVRDIRSRGKRPLFVGGTPLYLKALRCGLFTGPDTDPTLRARLEAEAIALGSAALHARLTLVDSRSAARLHPHDARRIIRALEVYELSGRPLSDWQVEWSDAPSPDNVNQGQCYWLQVDRDELYRKINERAAQMFREGLLEEARALQQLEKPPSRQALQAAGYQEALDLLTGNLSLPEALERTQIRSRRLAKRQFTWFRQMTWCRPIRPEEAINLWHNS